jgi:hypothetical protein
MDTAQDDRFMVYLRFDARHGNPSGNQERLVAACPSYAEAKRIRRTLQDSSCECVIRYVGPAGGGD